MLLDAIVLAGGRSSRLSGVPKAQLVWRGSTLLQNTVRAALAAGARRVVVVGPSGRDGPGAGDGPGGAAVPDAMGWPASVVFTREDPPFGGPAAAVAAGMRALEQTAPDAAGDADTDVDAGAGAVLVLACDMPEVARAIVALVGSLPILDSQGVILLDPSGRRQPLAAVYGRSALAEVIAGLRASGALDGASMRSLISSLDLVELRDAESATRDVDTWNDAAVFDIERPGRRSPDETSPDEKEPIMSTDGTTEKSAKPERSEAEKAQMLDTLTRWSDSLAAELGIEDVDVDIDALLALAGVAAHAVLRPAAPLTTYLVGFAAGRAAALEGLSAEQATARASGIASELARRFTP